VDFHNSVPVGRRTYPLLTGAFPESRPQLRDLTAQTEALDRGLAQVVERVRRPEAGRQSTQFSPFDFQKRKARKERM